MSATQALKEARARLFAQPKPEVAKSAETSRVDVPHLDHCPICGDDFKAAEANGHPVIACLKDNVVYPIADGTLPSK